MYNLINPRFEREFKGLFDDLFGNFVQWPVESAFNNETSFVKVDDEYTVTFPLAEGATSKNVSIDIDDDNVLTVRYDYKSKNTTTKMTWSELLPSDADADTIDAVIENGSLVVTAQVKEAEENKPETDHVQINRLSRRK